jgi:uncharacterized SAM-binding protein YcdF (DUF218 family)
MSSSESRAVGTRRFLSLLLLMAALVCGTLAFRRVGRWLVREDALARADVIVVLSGSLPYRAEEAAKVCQAGFAPDVWLTRPDSPSDQLAEMGISYWGEEDYNRAILIHDGVPASAVRVLPDRIVNTEEEIEEVARAMRHEGKTSIIIVTSPEHTRRVRTLWRKLAGNTLRAIVHGAPEDPFDRDHWWRDTRDILSVVREMLGLLNAWAGLPIRPHAFARPPRSQT